MDLGIPYRLTIGVVGRGGAEKAGELRRAAGEVRDLILAAHRDLTRGEIRVCVLSALGAGAESVVVDEILKLSPGAMLKAVMPLTHAEYLEDFRTDAARAEFERLLVLARERRAPTRAPLGEEYPAEMVPEARRAAHAEAAKLIARGSDVVIALGGCAGDPFAFMEAEQVPHFLIDPENPGDFKPPPEGWADGALAREIDAFNRRVAELEPDPGYFQNYFDSIFGNEEFPHGPSEGVATRIRDHLVPSYVAVSSLAKKYQRIYRRTGLTVFWLAFGIVGLVSSGIIFFESSPWVFLAEFLLLLLISRLIVRAGKKKASHRNWVEHRFLAERIRCGVFFAACGAEVQSSWFARHGAAKAGREAWVSLAFEEIWGRFPLSGACGRHTCQTLGAFVAEAWIADQIRFHESTSRRNDAMSRSLERAGEFVFTIAMLVALAHFAFHWTPPALHATPLAGVLTLATLMLPALGATLGAVRSHREYKRLARRSQKMAAELKDLKERFRFFTPSRLEALLREAEQLMLRENSDWLALMKFAELHKAV